MGCGICSLKIRVSVVQSRRVAPTDARSASRQSRRSIPPLPLEAGENEVLIVMTEGFGGWEHQAQFEDMSGISLNGPGAPTR